MFLSRLPTSAFSVALQSYMKEKAPSLVYGLEDLQEQRPCTPAVYDGLMPMLIQGLIEMCKHQYSILGKDGQSSIEKPSYLAIALSRDDDNLPFSSSQGDVEDTSLEEAQVALLSQTWFASHPLATCVSIGDVHREGPLGKALQALIASEASTLLGLSYSDELLHQAHRHFYNSRLPEKDDVASLLSACQISTLLAWRHTAYTRVKWGITSLALSCQLMAQIEDRKECQGFTLSNLKSFLSIMTVWAFAELGRSSGCLSVGIDPAASQLSQFYSSTAQLTSLLLNVHPDVHGVSMAKIRDDDFSVLCQQLRINLPVLSSNNSGASLVQAVQQILMLCLLLPRNTSRGCDYSSQQVDEVVARCSAIIPLLTELANDQAKGESAVPLLNKLTFHRQVHVQGDMTAMNCTIASIQFITAAEALQAVVKMGVDDGQWPAIIDLSHRLLETPLSLVVETDAIKQSRIALVNLTRRSASLESASPDDSIKWPDSVSSNQPSSASDSLTEETYSESDLFDCLWGQLQWDVPFSASAEI